MDNRNDDDDDDDPYGDRHRPTVLYRHIDVDGQARVHAGNAIYHNNYYITTTNVTFNNSNTSPRLREPLHQPGLGDQYNMLPAAGPDPTTSGAGNINYTAAQSPADSASTGYNDSSGASRAESISNASSPPPPLTTSRRRVALCQVLAAPTRHDERYTYFLDGEGLAKYIVMRYVTELAGPGAEVRPFTYDNRDGYLVRGDLPQEEQVTALRQRSRNHLTTRYLWGTVPANVMEIARLELMRHKIGLSTS